MSKYIDADILRTKITDLCFNANFYQQKALEESDREDFVSSGGEIFAYAKVLSLLDSLQQKQPEPYFYCKYGGTMSLCTDCKRNHNNSSFKTEEITTWYAPSKGTKQCIDYIQQERPEVDLEKEMDKYYGMYRDTNGKTYDYDNNEPCFDWKEDGLAEHKLRFARHFYELGLNARK